MDRNKRVRSVRMQKRTNVLDALFELKFVKNIPDYTIWDQRDNFKDFWDKWGNFNKMGFKYEDLHLDDVRVYALKSINTLYRGFYAQKKYKDKIEDIKKTRAMGAQALDVVNQVVVSDVVEDVMFDENQNEIARTKTQTITTKKIERIEFASELTIKAIENILASQELSDEWFSDYKKAIESANSGQKYNGKYQFYHLELAAKFKKIALDIADNLVEVIACGSPGEIKFAEARMRAAMRLAEMMDQVKKTEMSPVYTMAIMHEGGFNRQKELQGAITNDRQMIEMGNIIIKEEKQVLDRSKMREKLKEQGYSKIQDIFKQELMNVGAIEEEIDQELDNPTIIEVEDGFDGSE